MLTVPSETGFASRHMAPPAAASAGALRSAAIAASAGASSLPTARRVLDQATLNCCVSCALSSAMEVLNPKWPALAPLFHYGVTRFEERGSDSKGFLFLDTAVFALLKAGICDQATDTRPFTEGGAAQPPSYTARRDAEGRRPLRKGFSRWLSGPSWSVAIRDQIRRGCPVVMGIRLPMGYPKPDAFLDTRHEWADPARPGFSATGHCVIVTGFNDARTALRIQDSRGPKEFDSGGWWMGYRVADGGAVIEAVSLARR